MATKVKQDLNLTLASLLIIVCMALPSVVKLTHAIQDHLELQCDENIAAHFHQSEFDCEFQKLNHSQFSYPPIQDYHFYAQVAIEKANYNFYFFLQDYQKLHFSRRGPPSLL